MNQSTIDVIFGAVLVTLFGMGVTAMWRQADANRKTAQQLGAIAVSLAELNTGASAGARAAILDLREEMRNGARDVTRDVGQLRSEHDNLAERHHSLNGTVVQLAERVNGTRNDVHEIRRDIYAVRHRNGQPGGAPS